MDTPTEQRAATPGLALGVGDIAFILLMCVVLVSVVWIGILSYEVAMKTEETKRNGEALVAWLSTAGAQRFEPEFELSACAGGHRVAQPGAAAQAEAAPALDESALGLVQERGLQVTLLAQDKPPARADATWGGCVETVMALPQFATMRNPFSGTAATFVTACRAADKRLPGSILIEKLVATPAGSALAFVSSPLAPSDSVAEKMQLRISICDKGSDLVKIAEFDF
jgi:hypothetical protein